MGDLLLWMFPLIIGFVMSFFFRFWGGMTLTLAGGLIIASIVQDSVYWWQMRIAGFLLLPIVLYLVVEDYRHSYWKEHFTNPAAGTITKPAPELLLVKVVKRMGKRERS